MNILKQDEELTFVEKTHQYFKNGKELKSISKKISSLKSPADFEKIAEMMSRSQIKENGGDLTSENIAKVKKELMAKWDEKREEATDRGTKTHNVIEYFFNHGQVENNSDLMFMPFLEKLSQFFKDYYTTYNEFMLCNDEYAGTVDKVCQRQSDYTKCLIDIFDYKTNMDEAGKSNIKFNSMKYGPKGVKHYNRFMMPPVEFLEDCNYSHYTIQLNLYARMLELKYGAKIGQLGIINVVYDNDYKIPTDYVMIPVIYNPIMADAIFAWKGKSLPDAPKSMIERQYGKDVANIVLQEPSINNKSEHIGGTDW